MRIQPYLFFDGRCDEALAFYRTALGAEVTILMRLPRTFRHQRPDAPCTQRGKSLSVACPFAWLVVLLDFDTMLTSRQQRLGGCQ